MSLKKLYGRATGIGSMPHSEPDAALDLIFTYFKDIPHWPQLPRRGDAEGLISQYLAPLLSRGLVAFRPNGSPYFCLDDPRWEKRTETAAFAFTGESAAGFYAFMERCARQPL